MCALHEATITSPSTWQLGIQDGALAERVNPCTNTLGAFSFGEAVVSTRDSRYVHATLSNSMYSITIASYSVRGKIKILRGGPQRIPADFRVVLFQNRPCGACKRTMSDTLFNEDEIRFLKREIKIKTHGSIFFEAECVHYMKQRSLRRRPGSWASRTAR